MTFVGTCEAENIYKLLRPAERNMKKVKKKKSRVGHDHIGSIRIIWILSRYYALKYIFHILLSNDLRRI